MSDEGLSAAQVRRRKIILYIQMAILTFSATTLIIVQTYQNQSLVENPNFDPSKEISKDNRKEIDFNHPYF